MTPTATAPPEHWLDLDDMPRDGETKFKIVLGGKECAVAAEFLRIREIRKARFVGKLTPWRKTGWQLDGRLNAVTVQDCVLTLAPVVQRISEEVVRRFLPEVDTGNPRSKAEGESETPYTLATGEDDAPDPVGAQLDLAAVMFETLALALDPYPKAEGAKLETSVFAAPGVAPMTDADARPFAKLAALKPKSSCDD